MLTPLGMRGPDMLRSNNSVFRQPLQALAIFSNSLCAQLRAAPMPRFGSVADDSVWRVPKLTSFSTSAFRRSGFGLLGALICAVAGEAKPIAIMPASTCSFCIIVPVPSRTLWKYSVLNSEDQSGIFLQSVDKAIAQGGTGRCHAAGTIMFAQSNRGFANHLAG